MDKLLWFFGGILTGVFLLMVAMAVLAIVVEAAWRSDQEPARLAQEDERLRQN
jgi:hypothetical protein